MSVAVESAPTAAAASATAPTTEKKSSLATPEDDACPKCYRTKALHTHMKFMVSACGHKVCDHCMKRLLGASGVCICYVPGCGTTLRQGQFQEQVFEDTGVQTEVTIRKRIVAEFNKTREDFDDLDAFNDYLEDVEDIIFSLLYKVNVEEANRKIDENRKENRRLIALNKQRKESDDLRIRQQVEAENMMKQQAWRETFVSMDKEKEERRKLEEDLMKQLANITDPVRARELAEAHKQKLERRSSVQQGVKVSRETAHNMVHKEPVPKDLLVPYVYKKVHLDDNGPTPLTYEEILQAPEVQEAVFSRPQNPAVAVAGGMNISYVAARALQEAFTCLYT